jgi:toxin ParE1/3/4
MKYGIDWSKDASDELIEIIKETPGIGKPVQLLKNIGINDYRQIIEGPWIIYYRIETHRINIVSVIDGRRNLEELLYKKMIDGKIKPSSGRSDNPWG